MNLHVSFAVLEMKLNQNNKTLQNFHLWGCKAAALALLYNFFLFCEEKVTDYAENMDVSKLCGSAPLYPARYPVMASLSIGISNFFPEKDTLKPCYSPTP